MVAQETMFRRWMYFSCTTISTMGNAGVVVDDVNEEEEKEGCEMIVKFDKCADFILGHFNTHSSLLPALLTYRTLPTLN